MKQQQQILIDQIGNQVKRKYKDSENMMVFIEPQYVSNYDQFYYINKKCKRDYNEDRMLIVQKKVFQVYAVFDGHGGDQVSIFTQKYFMTFFKNYSMPRKIKIFKSDIYQQFSDIQNTIEKNKKKFNESGSTVNMIVVCGQKIIAINLGDSRCCGYNKQMIVQQMSRDHKPGDPVEYVQLDRMGTTVKSLDTERVDGVLAVARSLGDTYCKIQRIPEIITYNRNDFYMINTGTDGLYDVLQNQEFYQKSIHFLKNKLHPLVEIYRELNKSFSDNLSIILVVLKNNKPLKKTNKK